MNPSSGGGAADPLPAHLSAYSPDRAPTSCATCDEFAGSYGQTWSWGNQGSSTDGIYLDGARIVYSSTGGPSVRVLPTPGAVDWTAIVKYHVGLSDTIFLWILHTGTLETPTSIVELTNDWQGGTTGYRFLAMTLTGYDTWSSTDSFTSNFAFNHDAVWLRASYTAATKVVAWFWSWDGRTWSGVGTKTLTSHPSYVGRGTSVSAAGVYSPYFRIRTDASRDLAGE